MGPEIAIIQLVLFKGYKIKGKTSLCRLNHIVTIITVNTLRTVSVMTSRALIGRSGCLHVLHVPYARPADRAVGKLRTRDYNRVLRPIIYVFTWDSCHGCYRIPYKKHSPKISSLDATDYVWRISLEGYDSQLSQNELFIQEHLIHSDNVIRGGREHHRLLQT